MSASRRRTIPLALLLSSLLLAPAALAAADIPAAPQLVVDAGFHSARIRRVSASADGSRLLSSSDDKTARLYDGSGRLLRVLRVPRGPGFEGSLYSCALSPDGKVAALSGWTGFGSGNYIYLFDADSGSILRCISGLPVSTVVALAFAPPSAGAPFLACGFSGGKGLRVFDYRSGAELFRDADYKDRCQYLAFSPDGAYLASSSKDGFLRLYKRAGAGFGLAQKLETRSGKEGESLAFGKAGREILLGLAYQEKNAIDLYSLAGGALSYSHSPDTAGLGNTSVLAFIPGPGGVDRLVAGGKHSASGQRPLLIWEEAGRGARSVLPVGATDTVCDLKTLADGGLLVGSAGPFLTRLDYALKPVFALKSPLADFRGLTSALGLSADGLAIDFAYEYPRTALAGFSAAERSLSAARGFKAPDRTSMDVKDWEDRYNPSLDGKSLVLESYEMSRSLAIAPDKQSFLLGSEWKLRRFSAEGQVLWAAATPGVAWAVAVSEDGRLGAAACADGTIRWYRMADGAELLALYAHPDKTRWVAWTPGGYYAASAGAEELLGWHINRGIAEVPDYYPISRFRSAYYRPDVVSLALAALDERTALAQADAAAGRKQVAAGVAERRPPTLSILSPASGSAFAGATVRIAYRVSAPADAPVTGVRALVDGRPAEGAKGIAVAAAAGGGELSIEVPLPARSCLVSLIADNRNGPSEAATIQLVRKADEEFVIKPKLYLLAVGVSEYQNPDYRLRYAAKDARDLSSALGRQKEGIYREVSARVLVDAEASKDNILDGLDWIQKETTSKDVAIMYFSGHGINDAAQNYYYLPAEADLDRLKRTGVPFSDITTTVSAIAGKVLFFIDTCHSGNLMKGRKAVGTERDIVAVVNELASAENGAVVFASSTGNQYSYEDPSWSNGAFTKALIEGLSGKAAYGQDGRVTVNMLDLYLSERVKELTGGKQTPTTTKPANVPDFPVSLKGR